MTGEARRVAQLRALAQLLPPPPAPLEVPTAAAWAAAERSLAPLPEDYKGLVETYGTGSIDGFLWLFSPATRNPNLDLCIQASARLGALEVTSRKFPRAFPMARFPAKGGLLPFGGTDNGDSLFWVTAGEASSWTVAVMGPRAPDVFHFKGGLLEFLVEVLGGTTRCPIFAADFPGAAPLRFDAFTQGEGA